MFYLFGEIILLFERLKNRILIRWNCKKFLKCGKNIYISKGCIFTNKSIELGNNIYFGPNCIIQSNHGKIIIGNHVMFGPGVNIHGGNHIYNIVGKYIDQCEKKENIDGEVVISDDVWIGANTIILPNVHIGQGAIVGAGSVVTHDVEPYSIVVGNPARKIKNRFDDEELVKHKEMICRNNQCKM